MKSTRLLFSVAIILSFAILSGCGDDPDPVSIVGKWEITKAEPKITPSEQAFISFLVGQGLDQEDAEDLVDELLGDADTGASGTLDIKSDGTYEQVDGSIKTTGTWEQSSDGKTLTIDKGTSDMSLATISRLDAANMELDFDYSGDVGFPTSTGIGFHVILTFRRL